MMRNELRSNINVTEDLSLTPVSKQARKEFTRQIPSEHSLKSMSTEEKKREANKPMYLARYE